MSNHLSISIPLTDRQIQIMDLLSKNRTASYNWLAEQLGRSPGAIRRDVQYLEENGLVNRYRGGVEISFEQPRPVPTDLQSTRHWDEKNRIGKAASDLVSNNQVIAINAGTTAMAMAYHLLEHKGLTVVTADIEIAQLLITNPTFDVYIVGGHMLTEVPGVVGNTTLELWGSFYYTMGFMGVRAIDPKEGIMTMTLDQAASGKTVIEHSSRKVVIADSSKFYKRTGALIASLDELDILVTDRGIERDPELMERLASHKKLELIAV